MKQIYPCLIALAIFSACSNKPKPPETQKPGQDIEITRKAALEKWLASHGLNSAYFRDTMSESADSLWAYAFPLERTDTLYLWYPSTDSSYYLLTNIDRESGKNVFASGPAQKDKAITNSEDIEYRFLETRNKTVFIGMTLLNSGPLSPVDIFWYSPKTIHLLVKDKINADYELVTLKMGVDTIWSYRNRKVEMPANAKPSSSPQ
jgi:hypothetical protein